MKKILLISYHFPPSIAVGGLRIADFARYLPPAGWTPYVLTVKDEYLQGLDPARLKDINVQKIYKAGHLPTVMQSALKLKGLLKNKPKGGDDAESMSSRPAAATASNSETGFQKFKRIVISLLTTPDQERSWVLPAVVKAIRAIKQEKIDCILTTSPPCSVHLVGLLAKMVTNVKWVADFRDPWVSTGPRRLYVNSALSLKIELWMERKVIEKADLVLTTTGKLRDHYTAAYPDSPGGKFIHVTNGFSPDLADKLKHVEKYETFTLTYAGTLYIGRDPGPIFKAIYELVKEGKLDRTEIKVKLVGSGRFMNGRPISEIVQSYGLDASVEVLDRIPHATCLEIIKRSHVALLFAPNQPYQIPAKVFEYMGLGTKILALTEKGATWDLITSTGAGSAFLSEDIGGIKTFILQSMSNGTGPGQEQASRIQQQFDRKRITRDLAGYLDRIVEQRA